MPSTTIRTTHARALAIAAALALALAFAIPTTAMAQSDESNIKEDTTETDGATSAGQEVLDQSLEDARKEADAKAARDKKDAEDAKAAGDGKAGPDVHVPEGTKIPREMWGGGKVEPKGPRADKDRADIVAGDPEFGVVDGAGEPTKELPLTLDFSLRSEVHAFENLDLQNLDESTDQAIINTDDRATFAYSSIFARANYRPTSDLELNIAFGHNGLWSEDQLGRDARALGVLLFNELAFTYTPFDTEGLKFSTSIGRQPFRIGGVPRDYILDDVLDCAVLQLDLAAAGRIRVLAADFYTSNDLPSAAFVRYVGGQTAVLGLRGDTYTFRSGAVYENENAALDGLVAKAYGFYADLGGGPIDETGADLSYGGSLGNFSDNDWAAVLGARVAYDLKLGESGNVNLYGEFSHSEGIDRKETVAKDVAISGNAFGGGLVFAWDIPKTATFELAADFYHFDGAQYGDDGLETERGFVSFKGRQVGGLNLDRYAGWHPSAYVGSGGVEHQPNAIERIAGTEVLHAGAKLTLMERATLSVDFWSLTDTRTTDVDLGALAQIEPPFGYSREEFAAQERSGTALGAEIDVALSYRFNQLLTGYATWGTFLPGDTYNIRVDRVVGTALGGQDAFWATTAGAEVDF